MVIKANDPWAGFSEVPEVDSAASELSAAYPSARRLSELEHAVPGDRSELLKNRFLCRGGAVLLTGPTGVGKSSMIMQMVLRWAIGKEAFGIQPNGSLRTLIVQAENDDGDMAEMRDGIVAGLAFTEEEARVATAGVLVIQEDERTGAAFCGLLDHALAEHVVDFLVIDPALAYLGGEASSQKDVSSFLRNELNPVLRRRDVGAIVVHHTNKPITGKDKSPWKAGDHAYAGSGSAEWANWPRGVINLRNVGSHDQFELQLGKRGKRIGWTEEDGVTNRYTARIAHARNGEGIFWRCVTEQEEMVVEDGDTKAIKTRNDLLPLVPKDRPIARAALVSKAKAVGIGENKANGFIAELIDAGELHRWLIPRSGTRPEVQVAFCPQPKVESP